MEMKPESIDIQPGKSTEFGAVLNVPKGATMEVDLHATCGGCGGKLEHAGRGLYKCSRRWMFWKKHAELSMSLTVTKVKGIPNANKPDA
jgi:tRNA(Ile2) C34 agmatinyltransferase TiaS